MENITVEKLTPAERDVMFYAALGLTAEETAKLRGTTHNVVKKQRCDTYPKLNVYSMSEALTLLMAIDREFYDDVRQALNKGLHKPDGYIKGRGHERTPVLMPILPRG